MEKIRKIRIVNLWNGWSVICGMEDVGGQERVTADEEQVLRWGWREIGLIYADT